MANLAKYIAFIFKWPFIDTKVDRKVIFAFTRWFGSIPGFKQQMIMIIGWTLIDLIDPRLDMHMLELMAFLTIYSGATQPALAIGNEQGMEIQLQTLQNNVDQLKASNEMLSVMVDMLSELQSVSQKDSAMLSVLAEDVEELADELGIENEEEAMENARKAAMRKE